MINVTCGKLSKQKWICTDLSLDIALGVNWSHMHAQTQTRTHTSSPVELQLKLLGEVASDMFTVVVPDHRPEVSDPNKFFEHYIFRWFRYSENVVYNSKEKENQAMGQCFNVSCTVHGQGLAGQYKALLRQWFQTFLPFFALSWEILDPFTFPDL